MSDVLVADYLNAMPGAPPNVAFQAAMDYAFANCNTGGRVIVPPGNFTFAAPVVQKGSSIVLGAGRGGTTITSGGADACLWKFDSSAYNARLSDIFFVGRMERDATQNTMEIALNMAVNIEFCSIWGGNAALYNNGVDCRIRDCYISGNGLACLVSSGANFYSMVKFDTNDDNKSPQWCIYQGTPNSVLQAAGVCENFFDTCDFSGSWQQGSIYLDDTQAQHPMLYTMFNGCVVSGAVRIARAKQTTFGAGTRFGSGSFYNGGGSVSVQGCTSINGLTLPDNVERGTGNINIGGGQSG